MLEQTFGQKIRIRQCYADTYVSLQHSVGTGDVVALGDCHVISIDEVWVEELIHHDRLINIPREYLEEAGVKEDAAKWDHSNYVTTAQNLAIRRHGYEGKQSPPNFVIPDRNNVEVLTYNRDVWRQAVLADPMTLAWQNLLFEWMQKVRQECNLDSKGSSDHRFSLERSALRRIDRGRGRIALMPGACDWSLIDTLGPAARAAVGACTKGLKKVHADEWQALALCHQSVFAHLLSERSWLLSRGCKWR